MRSHMRYHARTAVVGKFYRPIKTPGDHPR